MGILFSKLFEGLFGPKEIRILMLGLYGAGKTTILYKLKLNKVVATIPTIGFNVETVQYKNNSFTVWDIGGSTKTWRYHYTNTQGLIFVIDTNDRLSINDVKEELMRLLYYEDELRNAVLLIFANKQDLPNAMNTLELTEALGLNKLKNRNWFIQSACATNGDGLYEGLEWLSKEIKNLNS